MPIVRYRITPEKAPGKRLSHVLLLMFQGWRANGREFAGYSGPVRFRHRSFCPGKQLERFIPVISKLIDRFGGLGGIGAGLKAQDSMFRQSGHDPAQRGKIVRVYSSVNDSARCFPQKIHTSREMQGVVRFGMYRFIRHLAPPFEKANPRACVRAVFC